MGFVRIYTINYYFHDGLKSWEDIEDVRAQCIYESVEEKKDVLLHLHPHTDHACEWDDALHEVYRAGKLFTETEG